MKALALPLARFLALMSIASALPLALAHGGEEHMDMDMSMDSAQSSADAPADLPVGNLTYFGLPEHAGAMYGHIVLMVLAWVVILPVGTFQNLSSPLVLSSANVIIRVCARRHVFNRSVSIHDPDTSRIPRDQRRRHCPRSLL